MKNASQAPKKRNNATVINGNRSPRGFNFIVLSTSICMIGIMKYLRYKNTFMRRMDQPDSTENFSIINVINIKPHQTTLAYLRLTTIQRLFQQMAQVTSKVLLKRIEHRSQPLQRDMMVTPLVIRDLRRPYQTSELTKYGERWEVA